MSDNKFLPNRYHDLFDDHEEIDPALERLITDLETVYTSANRPAHLPGLVTSVLETRYDTTIIEQPYERVPDRIPVRSSYQRRRRAWLAGLNSIVAAALVMLIVGSLLFVLYQAHQVGQARTGSQHVTTGLNRFISIHMIDASTGWAQISNARISAFAVIRTTDGGTHWQDVTPSQLTTPVDDNPGKLYVLNATTAWVTDILPLQYPQPAKQHAVLFRTTDAGQTWQNIALPPAASGIIDISTIQFLNAQVSWITIVSTKMVKNIAERQRDLWQTSDGGKTWRKITIPNYVMNDSLPFPDGNITFLDGKTWLVTRAMFNEASPIVYVTHDAGTTWQQKVLADPSGFSISGGITSQFFSTTDGMLTISTVANIILYTTHDGGDSWHSVISPWPRGVSTNKSVFLSLPTFSDMNHGCMYESAIPFAGQKLPTTNHLIITNDGGQHWTAIDVQMPGGQKGQSVTLNSFGSEPNPDFVSATDGWLVGYYSPSNSALPHSELFRTVDGGHTWTIVHYSIT